MIQDQPIRSDMKSEQTEQLARPKDEFGFYLVASNRELLNHVEKLMNRHGLFGVMDSSGRVHYVVDGRKGSPYATRKILATAEHLLREEVHREYDRQAHIQRAVDTILGRYLFNVHLRGYRLLQEMIRLIAEDISLLNPISKRLYPMIAERYKMTPYQVERNVRYLFDDLARREIQARKSREDLPSSLLCLGASRLPVARTVSRLAEMVVDFLAQTEIRGKH
ncbi:MAG TPA: hypothetical protein GX734_01855 [Clostridiaceae bacterium]|nr:hypothetical protein [Clostridiaceae bacterium]